MELLAELVEEMKKTTGENQKKLKYKILELDEEIYEDLLDEFDDELENNEIIEKKAPSKQPEQAAPPVAQKSTNETVLDELWSQGKTKKLAASFLKKRGFKSDFKSKVIKVGPYQLHRVSIFSIIFDLARIEG